MTRWYFLNMRKEKSRRALKGDPQLFWNERRGMRMTRQSGKGDQREEKGVDELLGKVTVIQRAHRVISHKAVRSRLVSRFCRNFRQSIFRHLAIYVDSPLTSISHRLQFLKPVCSSTFCFDWFDFYFSYLFIFFLRSSSLWMQFVCMFFYYYN